MISVDKNYIATFADFGKYLSDYFPINHLLNINIVQRLNVRTDFLLEYVVDYGKEIRKKFLS